MVFQLSVQSINGQRREISNAFVSRHLWMRSDDVGGGLLHVLLADRFGGRLMIDDVIQQLRDQPREIAGLAYQLLFDPAGHLFTLCHSFINRTSCHILFN